MLIPAADGDHLKNEDFLAAYGTLQLDPSSAPVTTKTVMWIASCSKLVTAVAVLQCVERGLFSLDSSENVDRLLPEWKEPEILTGFLDGQPQLQRAKEKITLRQLLTHTSGLAYDIDPTLMQWRKTKGQESLALRAPILECFITPLLFEPGTGYTYGPGLELAGLMVARANKCTLEEYMRKNIFDTLGMHDTTFRPLEQIKELSGRVMPMTCRPTADEALADGDAPGFPFKMAPLDPIDEFGGAGLFSTAEDYLKILKTILRNEKQVLSMESVDMLFAPSITPSSKDALRDVLAVPFFASIAIPGHVPGTGEWSHSVGGLIGQFDNDRGLKSSWIQWGGMPNLKWWIDREGGSCGIFATQLSPTGEPKHESVMEVFQKEMVKRFSKSDT
jgi:CubicO group peptidase (beta-lactamase class C family)